MIWICTLCLLFIAAWLFVNALNERRWVQAHSHDESVASDEGLFPSFTTRTGSGVSGEDGKVSIDQENTRFAKTVVKVQEKTAKMGEKYFESKAAAARIDNEADRPRSAKEENSLFGRAVARIGETAERIDRRLELKMKAASSQTHYAESGESVEGGLFAKASRKVSAKSEEISQRVANRARNASQGFGEGRLAADEDGIFGKMVNKVSGPVSKLEAKVDSKLASTRRQAGDGKEDLMTRFASKVGSKINELDDKFVEASKKPVNKLDKS